MRSFLFFWVLFATSTLAEGAQPTATPARTLQLTTLSAVRSAPDGPIVDIWNDGKLITSNVEEGDWIRITGYFVNDRWQPAKESLWLPKPYVTELNRPHPKPRNRYIVVDKSRFQLKLIQPTAQGKKVLFKAPIAVGMDRCQPKSKGGNCYYTDPGTYHVRWKVHDPKGIQWCIPKFMEKEYAADIARGQRCFRGAIGAYALNIGKSYAIHGTSNPSSIGKAVTHGCIRMANRAIRKLYAMVDTGTPVFIRQ